MNDINESTDLPCESKDSIGKDKRPVTYHDCLCEKRTVIAELIGNKTRKKLICDFKFY